MCDHDIYNILPLHDVLAEDNEALRLPEVRAALNALDGTALPSVRWVRQMQPAAGGNDIDLKEEEEAAAEVDMMAWLGHVFGFQADSVKNQREHVVLLLANYQMRIQPPPHPIDTLHPRATATLSKELLNNYTSWCSFLKIPSNLISAGAGAGTHSASSAISIHLRRHHRLLLRILYPRRRRIKKKIASLAHDLDLLLSHCRHPCTCFLCNDPAVQAPPLPPVSIHRLQLLYCCLYLLIWGEAANLRFMPECLCYIFHHMAFHLNVILLLQHCAAHGVDEAATPPAAHIDVAEGIAFEDDDYVDVQDDEDQLILLSFYCNKNSKNGFLHHVVTPIYKAVEGEARASKEGTAPHSAWRNYDDMNEFFWRPYCFSLGWPPSASSSPYLQYGTISLETPPPPESKKAPPAVRAIRKTGFVEQRSFLNIYRSFHHLWTGLILMLQAMMIVAFNGDGLPWDVVRNKDVQASLLTVFITWSGLRLLQALLDMIMQYGDAGFGRVRAVLKLLVAATWTVIFAFSQAQVWEQRIGDGGWSIDANTKLSHLSQICAAFVMPEMVALLLSLLPCLRNLVERAEWRIFHVLTWWFQTRMFVARGLTASVVDNAKYTAFWLSVLGAKFTFSYFLQVKPLVKPTRELLHLHPDAAVAAIRPPSDKFLVAIVWAPVVLVYLMDLQIWYAVFSSALGAMLGLSEHIGEIRNMQQLKLRFPFFASATTFNILAPQEGLFATDDDDTGGARRLFRWSWWTSWIGDMLRRVKLRYGLGKDYRKFESNTLEARKFSYLWNQILAHIREEDLISNHELELLEIPMAATTGSGGSVSSTGSSWSYNNTVQWPCIFMSNEILIALRICEDFRCSANPVDDKKLWTKISKNEYRRCAVLESYDSVKNLILHILHERSEEHELMTSLFADMESDTKDGNFCRNHRLEMLPDIHARVLELLDSLLHGKGAATTEQLARNVVNALQHLYDVMRKDFRKTQPNDRKDKWRQLNRKVSRRVGQRSGWPMFVEAVRLPEWLTTHTEDGGGAGVWRRMRRLRTILSTEVMSDVPSNADARRRIAFFSNSIFMNMPRAPLVERMLSFSVLTPYYDEDVMYSLEKLQAAGGVDRLFSMLTYLSNIYPDEWKNWLERMELERLEDPLPEYFITELSLWASYRGQTLCRTARGMMYYLEALETLAYLDTASEFELRQEGGGRRRRQEEGVEEGGGGGVAALKFTYVVACQLYSRHKARGEAKATDIQYLMKKHPAMRVAYVDEVKEEVVEEEGQQKHRWYSVLVKHDKKRDGEVEVYRIELPGNPKLGEGKPENQNHALVFTRGDAIQAIDMNQDHYYEEAVKMRNLLQEFRRRRKSGGGATDVGGAPRLLGVREHVFTGSASSLAWFMSAQESSFVTLGQRVLGAVLKTRMHYGHPDVFDRLWFLSRGGISKASRSINVSEDIFAGFNCTLRGGSVTHHEYIQVGKGRDVGLNQIATFEAKVSSGNGEQMLSRDVYRLAHRLDFFRMLSFYYTTVGFYISSMITILTVYAFLWGRVYLALTGVDASASGSGSAALAASMNQQFLVQLGMVTALPMVVENSLEHGFSRAAWDFLTMQLELCSVFFTFSLGTKGHYFGRTLLHGGARYRATGRNFVIRREKFTDNYRLFSRSHFVKAAELMLLLVIYAVYGRPNDAGARAYLFLTASSWCLALSWILAPFLFNPWGFQWSHLHRDMEEFQRWLWHDSNGGPVIARSEDSWEVWWTQSHDHLRTTGLSGRAMELLLILRFFVLHYGLVYRMHITEGHRQSIVVYLLSWAVVAAAVMVCVGVASVERRYQVEKRIRYHRYGVLAAMVVAPLGVVALLAATPVRVGDVGVGMLAMAVTGWGLISVCVVFKSYVGRWRRGWAVVMAVARLYELGIGVVVLVPLGVLSWLPGFQEIQMRILFHQELPPLPNPAS